MSEADATKTPAEIFNEVLGQLIPRAKQMGIEAVELRPGYAEARVPMDGNGNHIGTMYAGALFAVAEILGGAIVLSTFDATRFYPVVRDLKINFRRPVSGPVTATASLDDDRIAQLAAEAEANGRAQFIFTTELFDEAGERVADTEGTYQLRAHGS